MNIKIKDVIEVKETLSDEGASWMTVEFNCSDHKQLQEGKTLAFSDSKGNKYIVTKVEGGKE